MNRSQSKKSEHITSLLSQAGSLSDRVARAMRANGLTQTHAEQGLRNVITLRKCLKHIMTGNVQWRVKPGTETAGGHAAPVPHSIVNKGEFR
ncbi:hypothetical protein [Labrenzia sp. OB1]|uniref:hypothetical protein n=1 Tax=Labrenzia sp. OB1 TaxID=1561204 RepID=UPI000B17E8D3|nr:hypothetical protein [Labrenzia sp. OB1]